MFFKYVQTKFGFKLVSLNFFNVNGSMKYVNHAFFEKKNENYKFKMADGGHLDFDVK